jgi:hypothetical protein
MATCAIVGLAALVVGLAVLNAGGGFNAGGKVKGSGTAVTESDAREVLQRVLAGWSLGNDAETIQGDNADIKYWDLNYYRTLVASLNLPLGKSYRPQSFSIVACRKTKDADGNPKFEFSVTLTYVSEEGETVNKPAKYSIISRPSANKPWDVTGL